MGLALLLIDIQNDYFAGGAMELVGMEAAADNATRLLDAFRRRGQRIFHVQHISNRPGSTFFLPDTTGVDINPRVEPAADESVTVKHFPNAFRDTGLDHTLRDHGISELVICGAMSHMCIDASTRAAFDLGFTCKVVQDACATRNLAFEGRAIAANEVHGAFMAALGSVYATLAHTADLLHP